MHALLSPSIPPARLARYAAATGAEGVDPLLLYRWNSSLSLAVFDEISTVEVAMRSAMAAGLSHRFGLQWFRRHDLFDDDTMGLISRASVQGRLPKLQGNEDVVHGQLVASLMFGFWVKLLGRGAYAGRDPFKTRRFYDESLWKPALASAFPHVGGLERTRVERAAHHVQLVRNRIAHHEHILWGTPVFGQREPDGSPRRLSVSEAHAQVVELAGFLSIDLHAWLTKSSSVPELLDACPLADRTALLL